MAFGFGDIGSMFSKGMAQYGQGLDKMRAMPLDQKLMMTGQALHGASPFDMMSYASKLGQPGAAAPGMTPAGAVPPVAAPPAADPSAPGGQGGDGSNLFMGLLPLLMKNGFGGGLGGSAGLATGGAGGLLSGSGLGMGLGGLLGKFGFGH